MELRPSPRLTGEAASSCEEYRERLALPPEARHRLLDEVGAEPDPARAMAALHRALAEGPAAGAAAGADPALASVGNRLQLARDPARRGGVPACTGADPLGHARLVTTPPLSRTSIAPSAWPVPVAVRVWRAIRRACERDGAHRGGRGRSALPPAVRERRRTAGIRRAVLAILVLGQTAAAAYGMTAVLPHHATQPLELAILVLFAILFAWVSLGFWTGAVGFVVSLARRDPHSITRSLPQAGEIPPDARTAVVMPICNEHVGRVFAGLRATYVSLARAGALERFDFFVLSDSSDPDARVAETRAWLDLCDAVGGLGRIFYRWRRHRIKRKSGNVADFCRRWGSRYRYMVVLDADSVMSGACLTTLVRLMEANPTTGIIQTAPRAAGRETLYARVQQFATRVYGPVLTAGLNFWQLGESYYWGHNAIIRVAPFMRHCALARLPGRGVLSGEILSHDFVEAALMRRAGWAVWIAYDVPGSYEEIPPNLIQESSRDRRWCLGNLINSRLFWAEGLHPAHRAVFMAGVMTYVSAPLWLVSLALSTALIVAQTVIGPRYFVEPAQLFPIWPEWHVDWAIGLAVATASVLFLPRILAAALVLGRGARDYGGPVPLVASLLLEMVFSALLAPIRMLFHTQFVLAALMRWEASWSSPAREDAETSWGEALRRHGAHTVLGIAWATAVYGLAPGFLWWLLPTAGALAVSIPLSVYSSRVSLGRRFRRAGLLLIPEETRPPLELRIVRRCVHLAAGRARFADAVFDPLVNAVACATVPSRTLAPAVRAARARLVATAVRDGPAVLTRRERMVLLSDPAALARLHLETWASPTARARWRAEASAISEPGTIKGSARSMQ
jgi:membrane glycosyltransferase